jgi:hypothetical protein
MAEEDKEQANFAFSPISQKKLKFFIIAPRLLC